jgi:hypothetical protein
VLKEADAGARVADPCRKHGISEATYYNWKEQCGGMTVFDFQRLKDLEEHWLGQYPPSLDRSHKQASAARAWNQN